MQVVLDPYTESDIVAILSAKAGLTVQPAVLLLCAKHADGDAYRARYLCLLAMKACSDRLQEQWRSCGRSHGAGYKPDGDLRDVVELTVYTH
jgi:hypothetical protein